MQEQNANFIITMKITKHIKKFNHPTKTYKLEL